VVRDLGKDKVTERRLLVDRRAAKKANRKMGMEQEIKLVRKKVGKKTSPREQN